MDLSTGGGYVVVQQLEIVVEMVEGVYLDGPGLVPPLIPGLLGDLLDGVSPRHVKSRSHPVQRPPQLRVEHGRGRSLRELTGLYFRHIQLPLTLSPSKGLRPALLPPVLVQHLRNMADLDSGVLPPQRPADVHQAAHVARHERIRPRFPHSGHLVRQHALRNVGQLY